MLGNGNEQQMQMTQGMFCYPVRRARIYALDLQGKLAWPAPVDVDHQQFLLSQPGRLPVLVFAVFHYDNAWRAESEQLCAPRWWRSIAATAASFTTRIFRGPMRWMGVEIRGDPAEKTVRVVANNGSVSLNFTNKPIQATVRHSTGVKKPSGKLGEALLDAVQGAAGLPQ